MTVLIIVPAKSSFHFSFQMREFQYMSPVFALSISAAVDLNRLTTNEMVAIDY